MVHEARLTGTLHGKFSASRTVAVKCLEDNAKDDNFCLLMMEHTILKHPNEPVEHQDVLQLVGASTQEGPLRVVTELCEKGNLRDLLRRSKGEELDKWNPPCEAGELSKATLAKFLPIDCGRNVLPCK